MFRLCCHGEHVLASILAQREKVQEMLWMLVPYPNPTDLPVDRREENWSAFRANRRIRHLLKYGAIETVVGSRDRNCRLQPMIDRGWWAIVRVLKSVAEATVQFV